MRHVLLLFSLALGVGYWLLADRVIPGAGHTLFKMGGVAMLAAWAQVCGARPIAQILALGALGDGLIEGSLIGGALAFLAGHVAACRFYWQNRASRDPWGMAVACAGAMAVLAVSVSGTPVVAIYAASLGAMLGCAIMSRFPLAGLGAALFALSDQLLFARMGVLAHSTIPGLLIWPTYYFGQVLIAVGVVRAK